jgi:hypothetical protein
MNRVVPRLHQCGSNTTRQRDAATLCLRDQTAQRLLVVGGQGEYYGQCGLRSSAGVYECAARVASTSSHLCRC